MTAAAATASPQHRELPTKPGSTLPRVMRAEWTKLFSVRSTGWTLLALVAATIGLGVLASWGTNHGWPQMSAADRAKFDPVSTSMSGLALGQLAIAVLGVMVISSEYSTGGIRVSLTTVPRRMRLLTAKALVFTGVAFVVGLATSFGAFYAGQPWFSERGIGASLGDPGVLRAVIGGGLYVAASGLFGLAMGALLRRTAGAVTAAVALLLVVPPLMNLLPGAWGDAVVRYFSSNAGQQISYTHQSGNYLTPWVGFGVYCLWWIVPLAIGAWLMERRDA
jgi:ABC-type transport system involved in multi-copper enzyme maturation permease subunit